MCATDNVESQLIVYLCVSRSLKELPLPCAAQKFIPVNHHAPSREDSIRHTRDLDSLKHRIIHAHVVSFGADGVFAVWLEDNQIGVAAEGGRASSGLRPCQHFSCGHFTPSGGVKTYFAPSKPGTSKFSIERYKYCGQVSA